SKAAVRAQASISTLDANNRAIANILSQSNDSTTGQVRQLQLINQQLALIHAELASLVQNLATTGRVLTQMSAAATGEQMMSRAPAAAARGLHQPRPPTPRPLQVALSSSWTSTSSRPPSPRS